MKMKQLFEDLKQLPCSHGQEKKMHKEPLLTANQVTTAITKYTKENPMNLKTNTL